MPRIFQSPRLRENRPWLGLDGLVLAIFCFCFIVIVTGVGQEKEETDGGDERE
jgi:hypothetical protein